MAEKESQPFFNEKFLAVATTLPAKTLNGNLSYGVIETFENIYVNHFGEQYRWIVFVVALLLALGVFAEISAWIVGPSKALLEAAYDGILPARFEKTNKNGVSVFTIMLQAVIVTNTMFYRFDGCTIGYLCK